MMITVVPTTVDHVKELSTNIREKDRREAESLGFSPEKALFYSYKHGLVRRTVLVDDRVAAIFGVVGSPLGIIGQIYLITGEVCNSMSPIRFAKIYLKELQGLKNLFPVLENYVHSDYKGAVGMLRIAGFELSEPIEINGTTFQRFTMVN